MSFSLWVNNDSKDLPLQMYVTLRCGFVPLFSLILDDKGFSDNGRPRSIILAHEMKGNSHSVAFNNNELDSVMFTAEQFAKMEHVENFPPIAGKIWIPSSI
jgi:hypothetical protein